MTRILLVEDEPNLLKTVRLNLELEGYEVVAASNGLQAVEMFSPGKFSLVILDVMLPGLSGFDVCEKIRTADRLVPVLFLTAKAAGEDKVHGLRLGADDYLTKPFHLEEFLLRVQNLIRRSMPLAQQAETRLDFGGNSIDFNTYEASCWNGDNIRLSKREVQLLRLLSSRKNEVVSRDEILEKLWDDDALPTARTIDNFILAFRKNFEKNPREPHYFHSIRGVGYKFTPEG